MVAQIATGAIEDTKEPLKMPNRAKGGRKVEVNSMTDSKLVIAQVSDNEFVAASTGAPFFCTVGGSVEEVREQAAKAAEFYRKATASLLQTPVAPRITPHVLRVVPYKVDPWLADAEMNAA